jgi:hypothetical protein
MCNKPAGIRGWNNLADPLIDAYTSSHGSKAQKRLSMRNGDISSNHMLAVKYYNFLIINATSQKAHHARKKA